MINIIWGGLLIIGISFGFLSGKGDVINSEILSSSKAALKMILEILPILVLWMGLMKIAEDSGILNNIANFLSKPLKKLFPSLPLGHKSLGLIASNVAVNMLGLGNAATPFGLKAMEEMQKLNNQKDTASDAMITFLVLNTAGVTIIPTTVIALRILHKSNDPTAIILPTIFATVLASFFGLLIDFFIRKRRKK